MNKVGWFVLSLLLLFSNATYSLERLDKSLETPDKISYDKENLSMKEIIDKIFKDYFYSNKKNSEGNKTQVDQEGSISKKSIDKSALANDRKIDLNFSGVGLGAELRIFDKLYGISQDIRILNGNYYRDNSIKLVVHKCVHEEDKPFNESLAFVGISQKGMDDRSGWVTSSVINVNNIDNYRYNFWLLSCIILDQE